jgi:hypothetical protein
VRSSAAAGSARQRSATTPRRRCRRARTGGTLPAFHPLRLPGSPAGVSRHAALGTAPRPALAPVLARAHRRLSEPTGCRARSPARDQRWSDRVASCQRATQDATSDNRGRTAGADPAERFHPLCTAWCDGFRSASHAVTSCGLAETVRDFIPAVLVSADVFTSIVILRRQLEGTGRHVADHRSPSVGCRQHLPPRVGCRQHPPRETLEECKHPAAQASIANFRASCLAYHRLAALSSKAVRSPEILNPPSPISCSQRNRPCPPGTGPITVAATVSRDLRRRRITRRLASDPW